MGRSWHGIERPGNTGLAERHGLMTFLLIKWRGGGNTLRLSWGLQKMFSMKIIVVFHFVVL